MSITAFPLLPDTSDYGDLYMRGGIFREVALLNPVPSNTAGERNVRLGFFGVDETTHTQHALCVLETRAADETTRRAQLAIRVNRGNDGMEPPVDTLTLDGSGDFRLYNRASEQTFWVDTGGNVTTYGNLSADTVAAASQVKVGDKLSLTSTPNNGANITIKDPNGSTVFSASNAGVAFYDAMGGNFIIDGTTQQILTTYGFASGNSTFNGLSVTGDLNADNVTFSGIWRIVPVEDKGLFVQKNIDGVWTNKMRIAA